MSSAIGVLELSIWKEFDSRAMRKIDDGQEITFVLETDLAANTAGVNVFTAARLLLKLH